MYGSRIRDQFIKVYSLRPARARTGSMEYCCDARQYTPIVNGRISYERQRVSGELYAAERRSEFTQQRMCFGLFRRMHANPPQKAPNIANKPRHSRRNEDGGTRLPRAFERRKPGKASRSMAWNV